MFHVQPTERETAMRHTTRTDIAIVALSVILPFVIMLGGHAARAENTAPRPAVATSPRIGWSPAPATMPPDLHRAIVACRGVDRADKDRCIRLALRRAYHVALPGGASADVPDGVARVKECRSQYRGAELHACLWQPLTER